MNTQTKYLIILLLLLGWSGYVFSYFKDINFSKNYSDLQEVAQIQSLYGWTTYVQQRFSKKSDTTTSSGSTTTPQQTINDAIESSISSNQTYTSSDSLSFDDIINSISTDSTSTAITSTKDLEDQYKATQDPTIAIALITQLTKEYNYTKAYEIFDQLNSATIKTMNPHLVMRILFNSKLVYKETQDFNIINNMIDELAMNNLLSNKDAQRYKGIITLLKGDKAGFIANLPTYNDDDQSELKSMVSDIRQKIAQSTQGNDIPDYYSDGMIALGMFQYGYPYVAQQLSLNILLQYPHYILPKQILAYGNMIIHEWSQAQSYFLQLIDSDPKNISTYQFFAGVCSYRLEKYTDAVLYLNQIPQDKLVSDAIRYKILSYISIKDRGNVATQMKALLGYSDINNSDMMLAWEQMVFEPFMLGEKYEILSHDISLLTLYLETCRNNGLDTTICNLGELAKSISDDSTNFSESYLKDLLNKFPKSYIYYILGDYYVSIGDKKQAQQSYIGSMARTSNTILRAKISEKIKSLL